MPSPDKLTISPSLRSDGLGWAQRIVTDHHYLHSPVDQRCRPLAYLVELNGERVGCLIFGRPQATRCYVGKLTYGSFDDVKSGRAQNDRWEILNLARVWLDPRIQKGGSDYIHHAASTVIRQALSVVGYDYLLAYPPVDCAYPYQIRVIMSYCDTRKHNGWIYLASRFKLAWTNSDGIQTYMKRTRALTVEQDAKIRTKSERDKRSLRIRSERTFRAAQMQMFFAE